MYGKDFLSVADLASEEVGNLAVKAHEMRNGSTPRVLEGKIIALLFEKPSLRTRVSFEVGVRQLGGECIYLSKDDIGMGVREPAEDIARVLDRWVDGIVARVFSHHNLEILSKHTNIPVVNALSDVEHPCQAIADITTVYQHKGRMDGVKVAFVGDGNNVAASLALACASVGANLTIASPENYRVSPYIWEEAQRRASISECKINWVKEPEKAVQNADIVYTDVWVSMGDEAEAEERMKAFGGYRVDEKLMSLASSGAKFLHDMPAHRGEEITENMLDHPNSVVFDQAENRLHAQKAILVDLFSRRE